jgi:Mg/Co/Ni transporter MgtE
MDERIDEVRGRVHAAGWEACVVVNDERVVLGLLRKDELLKGREDLVEQIMRPGPSTFRPHVRIEEMAAYMMEHDLASSPITTSDGRLVGILLKEDALEAVHRLHLHHEHDEAGKEEPS